MTTLRGTVGCKVSQRVYVRGSFSASLGPAKCQARYESLVVERKYFNAEIIPFSIVQYGKTRPSGVPAREINIDTPSPRRFYIALRTLSRTMLISK